MSKHKALDQIQAQWSEFKRPRDGEVFEHYKGDLYSVVATGYLEETEVACVVYKSLKKDIVWVRTAKNFFETVEFQGKQRPRFRRVNNG